MYTIQNFNNCMIFPDDVKELSMNVRAIIHLLTHKDFYPLVKRMYETNIISIDDIYDSVNTNTYIATSEVIDLLLAENRIDDKICHKIMSEFSRSYSDDVSTNSLMKETYDKLIPFMQKDNCTFSDVIKYPLMVAEQMYDLDSIEFTTEVIDSLASTNYIESKLLQKCVQVLLSKETDNTQFLNVLGTTILKINRQQSSYNMCDGYLDREMSPIQKMDILYVDEFLDKIKYDSNNKNICINMLVYTREDNTFAPIIEKIINVLEDYLTLDSELEYDAVSLLSRICCSKSSDRMKKYYKYIGNYIYQIINSHRMELYDLEDRMQHDGDMNGLNIVFLIMPYLRIASNADTQYTPTDIDIDGFIKKLGQNLSGNTPQEKAVIIVRNLLDMMEADVNLNAFIDSN